MKTENRKNNDSHKTNKTCDIGIIGLGVMGRNLLLNMNDHGFTVAGYDKDESKVKSLQQESHGSIHAEMDLKSFIAQLKVPRSILFLVPAGKAVDSVIQELIPHLEKNDLIIDAGNSFFKDTDRRIQELKEKQLEFMGIGISGGEYGARHGPSIMPGGSKTSYARVQKLLEAVAAKVQSEPCVTYLGPGASGHYVKMVHNGIEYGIMQLIAETYDIMKRGLGFSNEQLHATYTEWDKGELNGYLIEITGKIFARKDDKTNKDLIDFISGVAKQLGTGMWTTTSAMELQIPIPTIDAAVSMRDLSSYVEDRKALNNVYSALVANSAETATKEIIEDLHHALYTALIITYAQGLADLFVASNKYEYQLNLENVAKIWRGGCIIRSALLQDISEAYKTNPKLSNLLLDQGIAQKIKKNQAALRKVIALAAKLGLPVPGLSASLAYLDAMRSNWLPTNLIQAQRDYFGSHTYERTDSKGTFHTDWEET